MLTPAITSRSLVQKGNPYHDATGAFSSKDKASGGGEKGPELSGMVLVNGRWWPKGSTAAGGEVKIPVGGPFRSKLTPTPENAEARTRMASYMQGFSKNLKNENERKYVEERVRQMVNGENRPKGMSGKFNLEKRRAIQYEALTYKIFLAGRAKLNV